MPKTIARQIQLPGLRAPNSYSEYKNASNNKLNSFDISFHNWYRFVLSYPPHLVRDYLNAFAVGKGSVVLDPFCGTGTTIVESKLNRIFSVGIEANPVAHFASKTKVNWNIEAGDLECTALRCARKTLSQLHDQGNDDNCLCDEKSCQFELRKLDEESMRLL